MKVFVLQTGQFYDSPSILKVFNDLKIAKCYALSLGFYKFERSGYYKNEIFSGKKMKGSFFKVGDFLLQINFDTLLERSDHPEIVELNYDDWCTIREEEVLG